jgi:hypothetical protein
MTEAAENDRFKRLLAEQLKMNPRTWAALVERGVDELSLIVIEFSFTAPGKRQANKLLEALGKRTSFDARLLREGTLFKRHWRVIGHTKPSTASVAMLNDWVTFMVALGAETGECRFDGWGVRIPEGRPQGGQAEGLQHSFGTGSNGHRTADD